tara:strand:- start:1288 stop:1794 length:507 start_codon:yes stop_codon:yes gene_type:complete
MIKINSKKIVLFISLFFLVFLIFLFYETTNMSKSILPGYPGDAFFPRLILIFSIFWTAILLFQNLIKNFSLLKSSEDKETDIEIYFKDIAFLFFISIIYILFLDIIGFEVLTFSFLFVLLVNRLDLNLGKSIFYSSLISFISMIIFWFVFIIFLKIPFALKFLPFLIY